LKLFKDKHTAILETRDKSNQKELGFDAVLIAIGRGLNHKSLNVSEAGIEETDRKKIVVNDYLQTTNKDIYVVGDAAGMYQFSHGAEKHVKLLRYNFEHTFFKKKHNADDLSWVTFTEPEIATFGISEKELQNRGINYWRQDQSFEHDDRAMVGEYIYGKISLYTTRESNKRNRKILGGSILSPNAGEMIQELQLAAQEGIKLEAFMDKIYAYPTASRINQQTVMGIVNYKGE
jgi:pyruvate/2-oxoglutarate dehydrogenase complex dihydrolipoamide dehydrogenase (E3) component